MDQVVRTLRHGGLTPLALPPVFWSREAPLVPVRRLMRRCSGSVVLALARARIDSGVEYVESTLAARHDARYVATDWTQIEAAIAFELEHPILVLREERVHAEGMLDPANSGLDVLTFDLSSAAFGIRDVLSPRLSAFRTAVSDFAATAARRTLPFRSQRERGLR